MTLDEKNDLLRSLTAADLRELGTEDVAYVRETEFMGKTHYAVHSATGQALSLATSFDSAMNAIDTSDLEPVTLH
jgi:hypothetical protein